MFTGLIEEVGKLNRIQVIPGGKRIKISARKILSELKVDDSVAVNGVCLTTVKIDEDGFWAEAVGDTLAKSTFEVLRESQSVNLERALRLSDRLGGHLVQGHINGIAAVSQIRKIGENYLLEIDIPPQFEKYLIEEGSIAVDGISLTIAKLEGSRAGISVIPHTWKNTNLSSRKIGDKVNIEIDVIAKYIEKFLKSGMSKNGETFSEEWFKKLGY